jgi:hypothetical protein
MTSRQLFKNMPVYAQLADQQVGVLQGGTGILRHICGTAQVEFDQIYRLLERRQNLFNPDLCPIAFLDWLGQIVGLGAIDDHYLGIGMNPDWDIRYKREVIKRAYNYFRRKGTEWGVREAIALWLQWEESHDPDKLLIYLPYGHTPHATRNLWEWGNEWGYNSTIDFVDRLEYGSGDYFPYQQSVPSWLIMDEEEIRRPEPILERSHLGVRNPWHHFYFGDHNPSFGTIFIEDVSTNFDSLPGIDVAPPDLVYDLPSLDIESVVYRQLNVSDWNKIFLDVFTLAPEIFDAISTPVFWGWLRVPARINLLESTESPRIVTEFTYDLVDGHGYGDLEWDVTHEWEFPEKITSELVWVEGEPVAIEVYGYTWNYSEPWQWGELQWEQSDDLSLSFLAFMAGELYQMEVLIGTLIEGVITNNIQLFNIFATWNEWTFNVTSQTRELPLAERSYFEVYPQLEQMYVADNWKLEVQGDRYTYLIKPTTIYWIDPISKIKSPFFEYSEVENIDFSSVVLEFVFNSMPTETKINRIKVLLGDNLIYLSQPRLNLNIDLRVNVGVSVQIDLDITKQ